MSEQKQWNYPAGVGPRKPAVTVPKRARRAAPVLVNLRSVETVMREEAVGLVVVLSLPPAELHPNWAGALRARLRAIAAYRGEATVLSRQAARVAHWAAVDRAVEEPHFYFPDARVRDEDNAAASLKRVWDGFKRGGVWTDDRGLRHAPPIMDIDRENPRVEVRIWADREMERDT